MNGIRDNEGMLTIGALAARSGISTDTVRYYERLGLLKPPRRTESGYRLFTAEDGRRLQFILRAKLLGLSLDEIQELLRLAEEGDCQPLRGHVADLLRRKIDECDAKLAEIAHFKSSLEVRYQRASVHLHEPGCGCAAFPAGCACLPVQIEELDHV